MLVAIGVLAVLQCAIAMAAPQRSSAPSEELWPLGLGALAAVPARYPPQDGSVAAARLKLLAAGVGIDFDVAGRGPSSAQTRGILTYVEAQVVRADDRVEPPPQEIAEFFRSREHSINAIRDLLVSAPIAWPLHVERTTHAPLPNLRAHLAVTRLLVARAMARSEWADLRAAWALQHGLWNRPELISQLVVLSSMRIIVAAASKLPAPSPSWLQELTQFDARRAAIAAMQWEAWNIEQEVDSESEDASSVRDRLQGIIMKPFDQILAGSSIALLRNAAVELAGSRQCAFDGAAFDRRLRSDMPFWNVMERSSTPNLGAIWQRVARFTAEREATLNVLALKEGRPPRLSSNCSDGSWRLTEDSSGSKHLRFSREIPLRRPQIAIPLEYTVRH